MVAGSFHIFSYREGAPLVYVQNQTTSEFLESKSELLSYRAIVNRVASVALPEAQSRQFIARMASEYEQRERPRMAAPEWRKSSYSGDSGNDSCVEVAFGSTRIGVRDSKNTDGPRLRFAVVAWREFVTRLA